MHKPQLSPSDWRIGDHRQVTECTNHTANAKEDNSATGGTRGTWKWRHTFYSRALGVSVREQRVLR